MPQIRTRQPGGRLRPPRRRTGSARQGHHERERELHRPHPEGNRVALIGPSSQAPQTVAQKEGTEMKIRHPLFVGLVAAFAVSLASVVSAVAAETPFKGTANAVETSVVVFPNASITRDGTGTATYLGKYTSHATFQVNLLTFLGQGPQRSLRRTATPSPQALSGRGPPTPCLPPCSRSSRSTPSRAERDASLAQPAASRRNSP